MSQVNHLMFNQLGVWIFRNWLRTGMDHLPYIDNRCGDECVDELHHKLSRLRIGFKKPNTFLLKRG